MLKRIILWMIPLVLIAIVAFAFIVEPAIGAHAASIHHAVPQYWNGQ